MMQNSGNQITKNAHFCLQELHLNSRKFTNPKSRLERDKKGHSRLTSAYTH